MRRLRTVALAATLLLVAGLAVSMALGLGGGSEAPSTPADLPDVPAARAAPGERVRVEVLNAAGIPGLAREGMRELRDRGFDVVYIGNARGFSPETTLVIDRVGHEAAAREVAGALGTERVVSRPDSTLLLEVTVVLGKDWREAADTAGTLADTAEEP